MTKIIVQVCNVVRINMRKYSLEIIVFLTGAVVMILELVGSRIIAPFAGTSIVVWTSLIGIILGSLSVGYFLGGKYADKNANNKTLGNIILLAALLIGLINFIKPHAVFITGRITDLRLSSFILTTILFAPSSLVLGMVPTYSVRLRLKNIKTSGSIVGRLYSISTVGSIVGTFLAGFYLISYFGSAKIMLLLSIVLIFTSFMAFWGQLQKKVIVGIIFFFLNFSGMQLESLVYKDMVVDERDSQYNKIFVLNFTEEKTNRPLLGLITGRIFGPTSFQTTVYLDGDKQSASAYTKYFAMAEKLVPSLNKALLVGGGGYAYPREFLKRHPEANIDVVELDPALTEMAYEYFGLSESKRLSIFHQDGRIYLEKADKKYDLIVIDVFSGDSSIPFHLTTVETLKKVKDLLTPEGLVVMNTIASIGGKSGRYFRAQVATFKSVFGNTYVFPVHNSDDLKKVQNIVLVSAKNDGQIKSMLISESEIIKSLYDGEMENDMPLLTDDFAPVDQYYIDVEKAMLTSMLP